MNPTEPGDQSRVEPQRPQKTKEQLSENTRYTREESTEQNNLPKPLDVAKINTVDEPKEIQPKLNLESFIKWFKSSCIEKKKINFLQTQGNKKVTILHLIKTIVRSVGIILIMVAIVSLIIASKGIFLLLALIVVGVNLNIMAMIIHDVANILGQRAETKHSQASNELGAFTVMEDFFNSMNTFTDETLTQSLADIEQYIDFNLLKEKIEEEIKNPKLTRHLQTLLDEVVSDYNAIETVRLLHGVNTIGEESTSGFLAQISVLSETMYKEIFDTLEVSLDKTAREKLIGAKKNYLKKIIVENNIQKLFLKIFPELKYGNFINTAGRYEIKYKMQGLEIPKEIISAFFKGIQNYANSLDAINSEQPNLIEQQQDGGNIPSSTASPKNPAN